MLTGYLRLCLGYNVVAQVDGTFLKIVRAIYIPKAGIILNDAKTKTFPLKSVTKHGYIPSPVLLSIVLTTVSPENSNMTRKNLRESKLYKN